MFGGLDEHRTSHLQSVPSIFGEYRSSVKVYRRNDMAGEGIYIDGLLRSWNASRSLKRDMAHWAVSFDNRPVENCYLRSGPRHFHFHFGRSADARHAMLVMPI
jgi:hypothetical protein